MVLDITDTSYLVVYMSFVPQECCVVCAVSIVFIVLCLVSTTLLIISELVNRQVIQRHSKANNYTTAILLDGYCYTY